MDRNQIVEVVFILDNTYVLPTGVAITSIIANKTTDTHLKIHLIAVELTQDNLSLFRRFIRERVEVDIQQVSKDKVESLHTPDANSFCVATPAALYKLYLPEILAGCNRVLYLDGDLIVRGDLTELYNSDLQGRPLGAVVDSGSIYFKHAYVGKVKDYFNSGMMLMDLGMMRRMNTAEALVKEKIASRDSMLMDQNVFNTVFDKQYNLLPLKYNCPYVNLQRARSKYTVIQLNERYGTNYTTLEEVHDTAVILHYSSKDKPWKNASVPCGEEWLKYCHIMMDEYGIEPPLSTGYTEKTPKPANGDPMVSIITPVYNLEMYVPACVESILAQTFIDFEMICVDDGSVDSSLRILMDYANRDPRIRVLAQKNQGQSAARNHGTEAARGRYIYYFDGDDMLRPNALEELIGIAESAGADVVLFDGDAFYETEELKIQFPAFEFFYRRRQAYPGITEGGLMFSRMVINHDYKTAPALFFIRRDYLREKGIRYREGILHEDNLFALQLLTQATLTIHTPSALFLRRVRANSIMTSQKAFENYLGFLTVAVGIVCFLGKNKFPQYVLDAAHRQLKIIIGKANEIYQQLDKNARIKPVFSDCNEEIISAMLISMIESACTVAEAMAEKTALEQRTASAAEKAAQDKQALEQKYSTAAEKAALEKTALEQKCIAVAEKAALEKMALEQKCIAVTEKATLEKMALEQKYSAAVERAVREKKAPEHALAAIRSSYSFKIGRSITWVPRKLRDGIRYCCMHSGKNAEDKACKP